METACSIHLCCLLGFQGSPVGCLGTAKSSEFTYYGVRDRWVKGALYLHGSHQGEYLPLWGLRCQGYLSMGSLH